MKPEIKNSILSGISFGVVFGIVIGLLSRDIKIGLYTAIICGTLFGTLLYLFVRYSKKATKQSFTELTGKGNAIYEGNANHFSNGVAIGGSLYLLDRELVFISHGLNLEDYTLIILINGIKEVSFYNVYRMVPKGLSIMTDEGETHRFVVDNRKQWKDEIEKVRKRISLL